MRAKRLLGVPFLYSAASAAVGFSIYFSIGVVADRGLGLTPTEVEYSTIRLDGIGGARPDEIGEVTEYVLKRAPCRVLLTAPPEES